MKTAETRNLSISINCDISKAYKFLSMPENMPKWASGLGKLTKTDHGWIAETKSGPMKARFSDSNSFGVLDHWLIPKSGAVIYIPLRVVRNGNGCELIFTLFRISGMTQYNFDADTEWVLRDLRTAKRLLE